MYIPDFQVCVRGEESLVVGRATEGFFALRLLRSVSVHEESD